MGATTLTVAQGFDPSQIEADTIPGTPGEEAPKMSDFVFVFKPVKLVTYVPPERLVISLLVGATVPTDFL
jgi:hypothetical protein